MLEQQKTTIDGIEFSVTPFPAIEAFKLQRLIGELFAGPLIQAFGSLANLADVLNSGIDGAGLSSAVEGLVAKLSEPQFIALFTALLKGVQVTAPNPAGQLQAFDFIGPHFEASFNQIFQGNLVAVYKLAWFVLKVNFPDFFSLAPSIGKRIGITASSPKDGAGSGSSSTE
jgi:hypothetical protein